MRSKALSNIYRVTSIIFLASPIRFAICILLLLLSSSFSLITLIATNHIIQAFSGIAQISAASAASIVFYSIALLLSNSMPLINILGSYLWITSEIAVQKALIRKTQSLALIKYDQVEFYNLLDKAKQSFGNAIGVSMMLISAVCIALFSTIGISGYLLSINLGCGVFLLLILLIKILSFRKKLLHAQQKNEAVAGKLRNMELLSSYLSNKETRIIGALPHFYSQWRKINSDIGDSKLLYSKKDLKATLASDLLSYLCFALMLVFVIIKQIADKNVSIAQVITMFIAAEMIYGLFDQIIAQFGNVFTNASLTKDLFAFLDAPVAQGLTRNIEGRGAIAIKNVSFAYPNKGDKALDGISLAIKNGETVALVGTNGSGKSTLIKLLAGLYGPDEGSIAFGEDFGLDSKTSTGMSAVFQDFNIYNMTIGENIAFSSITNKIDAKKAQQAIGEACGAQWSEKFECGINTFLGREFGGAELSMGEKQRLAIARAFFRPHSVIFMDEPTSAIDPILENRVLDRFIALARNSTAILVTHRLSSVRIADRIIVLEKGRLVEDGTHEELMKAGGRYATMYTLQKESYAMA